MEDSFSGGFVLFFHLGVIIVISLIACGICALVNHGNLDNLPEENITTVAATPESTPSPEPAVAYQGDDGGWYINVVVAEDNGEEHLHRIQVILCEADEKTGLNYFIPTPVPN